MNEIEKIKRRIDKRKHHIRIDDEVKVMDKANKSNLFKIVMSIMTLYVLFMSFAIYARKDESGTMINSIFNTNVNFTKFNNTLNKFLNFKVVETPNTPLLDQAVSSDVNYINLGDDYYTSDGNMVVSMFDGIVSYVNGKDNNYTVIVEYNNGVRATYNNVNEVNVYVNDVVYQNDILGTFNEKVGIIFIKDNEKISYEEVIAIK